MIKSDSLPNDPSFVKGDHEYDPKVDEVEDNKTKKQEKEPEVAKEEEKVEEEQEEEKERETKKVKREEGMLWSGAASNIGEIHHEFQQPNQDNFLINDEKRIYAVFDGHGDKGHLVSTYLRDNLASTFYSSLSPSDTIETSFRSAFKTLDDTICKSTQSESSGSTCVMAYFNNNNLYVAGVGDCTALLVEAHPLSGKIDTTSLLSVHKISNNSEFERITKFGAQVAGEYVVCKSDPNKVINMTRAFGDQDMKSAGIISRPDISITKLSFVNNTLYPNNNNNNNTTTSSPSTSDSNTSENDSSVSHFDTSKSSENDTFLMLFSDGLDQVQSSEQIARKTHSLLKDHVKSNKDTLQVNTICSTLLQQLEDGVYDRDGIGFSDDATVIVVLLSGFS